MKPSKFKQYQYLVFFLFLVVNFQAMANNDSSLTIFRGQGADTDIYQIIPKFLNNEMEMDAVFFWGINYRHSFDHGMENWLGHLLDELRLTTEWEAQVSKHEGLQNNYETHLALALRTSDYSVGSACFNFAAGMGPSYAFSKPRYEDGPDGEPNQGEYQFQNYILLELETSFSGLKNWSFPLRVHHRSGVYGLVAPRRVGSNFFALGARFHF